jgi:outer membrane protein OmpU
MLTHEGKSMKKLLIASTALVASAGFASADITLGGSANAGVKYNGGWDSKSTRLHYEIDFDVIASGTTDGGLTFGASLDLDTEITSSTGNQNTNGVKDPEVFISGDFGTLTVGNLDVAADDIGMKDVGFDGIGIDNAIDNIIVMGTDVIASGSPYKAEANAAYRYTTGGFTGILTIHTIQEDYGIFAEWDGGFWQIAGAHVANRDAQLGTAAIKGSSTTGKIGGQFGGGWDVNFYFGNHKSDLVNIDGMNYYGLDVSYTTGPWTITGAASQTDLDVAAGVISAGAPAVKDKADYGIGVGYDLGGGATLVGAVGRTDGLGGVFYDDAAGDAFRTTPLPVASHTVADFGVNMKF